MSILLLVLQLLAARSLVHAPLRYKIVTRTNTDIDLTAAGQGSQTIALVSTTFVTVNLSDTAGGQLANIVVDSSAFDGGAIAAQLPPAMLAIPRERPSISLSSMASRSRPILPTPMSVQAVQAAGGIELFLTGLRTPEARRHLDRHHDVGHHHGRRIGEGLAGFDLDGKARSGQRAPARRDVDRYHERRVRAGADRDEGGRRRAMSPPFPANSPRRQTRPEREAPR